MDMEIAEYSVRITDGTNDSLIGSGTLLVIQSMVYLVTNQHVIDLVPAEGQMRIRFPGISGSRERLLKPQDFVRGCQAEGRSVPPGQDFAFCELDPNLLRSKLAETEPSVPTTGTELHGFGYAQRFNRSEHPVDTVDGSDGGIFGGRISNAVYSNDLFRCRFDEDTLTQSMDKQLLGCSGSGLYTKEGKLIGIVKGRSEDRCDEDKEFDAIKITGIIQRIRLSSVPEFKEEWKDNGLARILFTPDDDTGGQPFPFLPNAVRTVNLWSLLLVLKRPVVLFLFNKSIYFNEALSNVAWLNKFDAATNWTNQTEEREGASCVFTIRPNNQDLAVIRQQLSRWKQSPDARKGALLFNLDFSEDRSEQAFLRILQHVRELLGIRSWGLASEEFFSPEILGDLEAGPDPALLAQLEAFASSDDPLFSRDGELLTIMQKKPFHIHAVLEALGAVCEKRDDLLRLFVRWYVLCQRLSGERMPDPRINANIDMIPHSEKIPYILGYTGPVFLGDPDTPTVDLYNYQLDRTLQELKENAAAGDWQRACETLSEMDEAFWFAFSDYLSEQPSGAFSGFLECVAQKPELRAWYDYLLLCNRWGFCSLLSEPGGRRVKRFSRLLSACENSGAYSDDAWQAIEAAAVWQRIKRHDA